MSKAWRLFVVLALVTMSLVIAPVAQAATTVSITDGDVSSLISAITAANSSGTPTIINLATGGDYVLETALYDQFNVNYSGLPEITGNVTINGNGSTIERNSTAGAFGVVDIASTGSLKLDNATITGGSNSTYYQNGGGIYNHGTLTVTNSTITGNAAPGGGGGIYNTYGSLTVIGSTISDNTSNSTDANSAGGGIDNANGTATVVNSTITGNSANYGGGGIDSTISAMTVINSTVVGNTTSGFGGGILGLAGGDVTISNSIVAGNTPTNVYDSTTDAGHNLIGGDPLLGPLEDNGGPTETMAPQADSPAVDAGDDTICANAPVNGVDQRGFLRPAGTHCDIGAVEYGAIANQAPTVSADQTTVTVSEGQTATDTGTVSDPDGQTVSLSASIGSVTNNNDGTWSWSFPTTDGPSQSQTVTISGDDGFGGTSQTSFYLTVSNVAPTATFTAPSTPVNHGGTFDLSLTNPFDPSSVDTTAGFTYAFDCGSGYGVFSSTNSATCSATTTPSQSVKAKIKDKDGGTTEYTDSVSVTNTPPVTTATATNADNSTYTFGDWTHQAVTITLSAADSGSGVGGTFYTIDGGVQQTYSVPFTISAEGTYSITYWSIDEFNNPETSHTVSVKIDLTGPSISGTATTSPNANGWYKGSVTIHWTCSDALSGIATCPVDQTISAEGTSQTVSGTATDLAGNSTTVDSSPAVKIDLTNPTISGTATTSPNGNGWYNGSVTIHWTCSDSLSGIATCPSDQVISTEGANQTVSGTATDLAGNSTTVDSSPAVNIDLTGPTISGSPTTSPNGNGWYNGSVTIHWTCSGSISPVANCPSDTTISTEGANQTVSGTATDDAGNSTTVDSSSVNIDLTAPTISGVATTSPNGNDWFNSTVTIHWTCSDALSTIATCPVDQTISTEGADQTVSGTATDLAGNSTTVDSSPVNIDLTAPTDIVGTPARAADSNGWYNHAVTVTFSGSDAGSGIASCSSVSYSGPDNATASVPGTCTDLAGNRASGALALAYDATAPTITYTGNAGSYSALDTVNITCTASDAVSGVASTTCQNLSGPAYTFGTGAVTFSSAATDNAGNVGHGSVTFTITANVSTLATLTQQYETNRTVARQLTAPLRGIQLATALHNARLKAAFVNIYIRLVNIQRGHTLTNQQADTLIALAQAL